MKLELRVRNDAELREAWITFGMAVFSFVLMVVSLKMLVSQADFTQGISGASIPAVIGFLAVCVYLIYALVVSGLRVAWGVLDKHKQLKGQERD